MNQEILFNFPQLGWILLLLIPYFLGQLALSLYRKKQLSSFASSSLTSHLLVKRSSLFSYTKVIGWGVIWILICIAFMQPYGNIRYPSLQPSQSQIIPHEVIFLVDTSASMRVTDTERGKTRLEEAQEIMENLLRQLRGQTISVYAFTSELSLVVPPTLDYIFARLSIHDLQIDQGDVGGTRFEPILKDLQRQAFPVPSEKRISIVMLSDGGDTQLESLKEDALKKEEEAILNAISDPEQFHLKLFTIGMGSLKGQPIPDVTLEGKPVLSKLEPTILKLLAKQERGKFYMAEQWNISDLTDELLAQMKNNSPISLGNEKNVNVLNHENWITDLYYQIPLGLAILFYFLNLLLPDVRRL